VGEVNESFWRDRAVFVTGGTGLLGSALVQALVAHGANVVALVRDDVPKSLFEPLRSQVTVVRGQLEDYDTLVRAVNEYEVDTVFHLGAQTLVSVANRGPLATFEVNVRGTYNLLEACRVSPLIKAVVVASSDKAYGGHDVLPYDETTPLIGRHPYDVSKSCADLITQAYHHTYGMPVSITRCGNLYGPGDFNWNRIIPGTVRSLLRGERPIIRSDGSYIRDYFFVEDGVQAYLELATSMHAGVGVGEAFNFSNELQVTVLQLVERIRAVMQSSLEPLVKNEARGEILHQYLDASKARGILQWTPKYTLDEGLKITIDWYVKFLSDTSHEARR